MTLRARPTPRPRRRTHWQNEERTQFLVTIGFIVVVVLVLLALAGAVGADFFNRHLKSVAKVENTDITVDQWADRAKLDSFRISRATARIRDAIAAGELDATAGRTKIDELSTKQQSVTTDSLEELIDLTYQGYLAAARSLTVTPDEVTAAQTKEASLPERRKVLAIFVEPKAAAAGNPTPVESEAALTDAQKALADLNAGKPFADVARQYSTDASKDRDGDYGSMTSTNATDPEWVKALFELPSGGTTDIIKGDDGVYRIGRVAEITPGADDPSFETDLKARTSLDAYKKNLERELLAQKLTTAVVNDALAGDKDQVRLAEIFVAVTAPPTPATPEPGASPSPSPAPDEGQVKVRHILYSPKKDPGGASKLPADDPAWAEAQKLAQAATDKLKAISDVGQRETAFEALAKTDSDDTGSGAKGGQLDFADRSAYVTPFADAIFVGDHTKGEIIGPVKSDFGYHVIFWQQRRAPSADRITQVDALLKAPGADFAQIAKDQSEGAGADSGGVLGWMTRDQLATEVADAVFPLQAGGVTGQVVQDDGVHWYKVLEHGPRTLDPDQRKLLTVPDPDTKQPKAFQDWYTPQKDKAEADQLIIRDQSVIAPEASGVG
jgi:parvulin-like peptidyl-prolyl isomerase